MSEAPAVTTPQDSSYSPESLDRYLKEFFQYHLNRQTDELIGKVATLEEKVSQLQVERDYFDTQAKELKAQLEQKEAKGILSWMK